jgi:hypothetical protein
VYSWNITKANSGKSKRFGKSGKCRNLEGPPGPGGLFYILKRQEKWWPWVLHIEFKSSTCPARRHKAHFKIVQRKNIYHRKKNRSHSITFDFEISIKTDETD